MNYNFINGIDHEFQGDHNILFCKDHRILSDASFCTFLGYGGRIISDDANSAVMKYSLGENNDIFVLTRQGDVNIQKDICCNDIIAVSSC